MQASCRTRACMPTGGCRGQLCRALPGSPLLGRQRRCGNARRLALITYAKSGDQDPFRGELGKIMSAASRVADEVADVLTPRQAYDAMDLCLMAASMCIFVWVAGAMYVLYAHMYYSHMQW